jgi:hypothetical protein
MIAGSLRQIAPQTIHDHGLPGGAGGWSPEADLAVDEIDALKARLDGDIPRALHWLQGKAERQRHALDGLNRRVLSLTQPYRPVTRCAIVRV